MRGSIRLKENEYACTLYRSTSGNPPEKKRVMVQKITEAVEEAYHIGDTLIFLREYPVENVAMDERIQSENPTILEALKKINAGA
jgi:hypothetical protein